MHWILERPELDHRRQMPHELCSMGLSFNQRVDGSIPPGLTNISMS
jgi:hypothetical protein